MLHAEKLCHGFAITNLSLEALSNFEHVAASGLRCHVVVLVVLSNEVDAVLDKEDSAWEENLTSLRLLSIFRGWTIVSGY